MYRIRRREFSESLRQAQDSAFQFAVIFAKQPSNNTQRGRDL